MPRPGSDATVTLSVFDRLLDYDPRNSREVPPTRAQAVRLLKDSVRRDLEWLLNTRSVAVPPDDKLKEVNRSLYVFGLPDFTAVSLASPADRARIVRQLQNAVKLFEPRLGRVRIVPVEDTNTVTRTLHFRIEGLLMMDPSPEHVAFDTVMQLSTGVCEVSSAG